VPKPLDEIYRLQNELTGLDPDEQRPMKMCANLLESTMSQRTAQPAHVRESDKMPAVELIDACWQY